MLYRSVSGVLGFMLVSEALKSQPLDLHVSGAMEATPASSESLCGYIISRRPMMYLQIKSASRLSI